MLPYWARDAITIHRPQMIEERGSEVPDYSNTETHVIEKCSFQPQGTYVTWTDTREPITIQAIVYLEPDSDIQAGDLVEFNGVKYAINGAPQSWRSPSGRVSSMQANLIAWDK